MSYKFDRFLERVQVGLIGAFVAATGALVVTRMGLNPIMKDADGAKTTITAQHPTWTDVETTGYGWMSCQNGGSGDIWRTKFNAINEAGQPIKGVVCEGVFSEPVLRGVAPQLKVDG